MSTKSKRKKQVFPIVEAQKIAFTDQPPEAYYDANEKVELQAHKDKYIPVQNIKKRKNSSDFEESESESESESISVEVQKPPKQKKPQKKPHKKPSKKQAKPRNETEESKENKGILSKIAETAKEVVGSVKDKPKKEITTEYIIELPRDILTAFFLLRLPRDDSRHRVKEGQMKAAYWNDYSLFGKVFLWISVLMPYIIQWFVLGVLLKELATKWEELKAVDAQNDFWYNTVAFAVLFLYMWRDLAQFYFSVWKYIVWLQKKQGGILSSLKEAATEVVEDTGEAKELAAEAVRFIEFRLWLLSVVFLYFGLTCYSLLSIPLEDGLVSKLEISLSVFFVLEVDDWAYELFIAQANILDDEEFDVHVMEKKDRKGFVQKQQKHLATTVILVISSIIGFWVIGWGLNQIGN